MYELNTLTIPIKEATTEYGAKYIRDDSLYDLFQISEWRLPKIVQTTYNYEFLIEPTVAQGEQKTYIDWPRNENPFTQENVIDAEDNLVQELIFQIRRSFSISHHENLANRLYTLFDAAKEEDPGRTGITVDSLLYFYRFLRENAHFL